MTNHTMCLLKGFNRLMFSRTKHKGKKHYCMSCLQGFNTEDILSNHKKQCLLINGCQAVNYESGIIKFTNQNKQIKYQEHQLNSIGAKIVCIDDRFTLLSIIFKGKDRINKFITCILDKQKWAQKITKKYFSKRLIMISEDEETYSNSHICWICKQELNADKVKDYCHVTGKFRGAPHNKCNLK